MLPCMLIFFWLFILQDDLIGKQLPIHVESLRSLCAFGTICPRELSYVLDNLYAFEIELDSTLPSLEL